MKIRWSPRALTDYLTVLEYLQREWGDRPVHALVKRIDDILHLIEDHPQIFSASKRKTIRRCVVSKQLSLYYRENDEFIELIAFIDNRSNPKSLNI